MIVGVSDKVLNEWLEDKEYLSVSDEGIAVAVGAGHFLATGERATVFMSADGFCNALNPLTSWVIPEDIEMDLIISTGRQEPSHKVMSDILEDLIDLLPYDPEKISLGIIEK